MEICLNERVILRFMSMSRLFVIERELILVLEIKVWILPVLSMNVVIP